MDVIEKIIWIFHNKGAGIASEGTVGAGIASECTAGVDTVSAGIALAQYMSAP